MGRQINETKTIDSITYETDTNFNLAGRLNYIIYPDNVRYDYIYDTMGRLIEVKNSTGYTYADFSDFNALGQMGYSSYGNAVSTEYAYYPANFRLQELSTHDGENNNIQTINYAFDNVGNITTMSVSTFNDAAYTVNHSFVYDEVDRLTSATATCSNDQDRVYNQGYVYDLAGNMTSKTGIGGWQVLGWESGANKPKIRPSSVQFNEEVAGAETTIYVGGIYEIRDGHEISYIFANGKKIATITDTHTYYTHSDHLGSTSIVTDENGIIVEEIGYLPFGATLFRNVYSESTWESAYRFTGQEFDEESQLYNYNARLYDPIMCRFISPDTIVPSPYNPQSLNRYTYCLNNPLNYTDPSGHFWKELKGWFDDAFNWMKDFFPSLGGVFCEWLGFGHNPTVTVGPLMDDYGNAYGEALHPGVVGSGGVSGGSSAKGKLSDVWDKTTQNNINTLHPKIRQDSIDFIMEAQEKGYNLRIYMGKRTFKEQNDLYAQGRDTDGKIANKLDVVTYPKGGESYHNYGLALDLVEIKNGKALWVNDNWKEIGNIGKLHNFEWGGNWTKLVDKPHFQNTFGKSAADLLKLYNDKKMKDGYVDF